MNEFDTIEQLVNYLNERETKNDLFEIVEINKCKRQLIKHGAEYVTFYLNGKWRINRSFPSLSDDKQGIIINFLTDGAIKDIWFDEIKYNVIIGKDTGQNDYSNAVYAKRDDGSYRVVANVDFNELANDEFCFSELEIKDLKEKVGAFMAEIVDKGIEEV